MLELRERWISPPFSSLTDPLWPRAEAADRVLSMRQIELFEIETECKQMTYAQLNNLK